MNIHTERERGERTMTTSTDRHSTNTPPHRDYAGMAAAAATALRGGGGHFDHRNEVDRDAALAACVELLWPILHPTGVSWLGFYIDLPEKPDDQRLILGPHRDRPACSPIGLHGVCGRALIDRRPCVVHDVAELGPNYIACDPRDRSEVVVPLLDVGGRSWAVLDLDSHEVGGFDDDDAEGLVRVLRNAGLTI